jgi:hypothetical protein
MKTVNLSTESLAVIRAALLEVEKELVKSSLGMFSSNEERAACRRMIAAIAGARYELAC